ncbi:hypothetical protein FF38_09120 [Lucilia cuprina]|uniref:Uncharacterized protein n=1 Tax=Lucilia cuprina TaxID=7375 RepID=A0A0L0BU85_LUCCU|nr:hypothetical protein FF38_09120 [Lucilia cuprina]
MYIIITTELYSIRRQVAVKRRTRMLYDIPTMLTPSACAVGFFRVSTGITAHSHTKASIQKRTELYDMEMKHLNAVGYSNTETREDITYVNRCVLFFTLVISNYDDFSSFFVFNIAACSFKIHDDDVTAGHNDDDVVAGDVKFLILSYSDVLTIISHLMHILF